MSASRSGLTIAKLAFTGDAARLAELVLLPGLNLVYGASNTGKSFTVKTVDFMLGSSRPLPEFDERRGFERAWMALTLPKVGDVTLMRALAGGTSELYAGHIFTPGIPGQNVRQLSARHDHANTDAVSTPKCNSAA